MTLVETDEPAGALRISGDGVMQLRRAACQTRIVEVVVTQDAQVVSSAVQIAFLRDARRLDDARCSSGSASLVAGGHR